MTITPTERDRLDRCQADLGPFGERFSVLVPGRLEFLGKHTEDAGGRSLVCAIERGIVFAAASGPDDQVRIVDAGRQETLQFPLSPSLEIGSGWATYPMTTARRLARNFPGMRTGVNIVFASDLPPAAGLSSSSALVTGCFMALTRLSRLTDHPLYREYLGTPERVAEYVSCIENGRDFGALKGDTGVGTLGGSQDHAAILLSEPGHLLQCAFHPLRREQLVPVPSGHVFVIANSGVVAEKTGAALERFNRAARIAARIIKIARAIAGSDASLFRILEQNPSAESEIRNRLAHEQGGEFAAGALLGRFEQMLVEANVLVPDAAEQIGAGDLDGLGYTVELSQLFAERLLGNQVPETVVLARTARELGAVAASAFGAGFGGSVWALVAEEAAEEFVERWRNGYGAAVPEPAATADFLITGAGPALRSIASPGS
jgi:galactokinase